MEQYVLFPKSLSSEAVAIMTAVSVFLVIVVFCHCLLLQFLTKTAKKRLGYHPTTGVHDIKAHVFFSSIEWDKLERKEIPPPYVPKLVSNMIYCIAI